MDLDTNGYVANGMYDNIRGLGGYGVAQTIDTDRQIQDSAWHTEQKFDDLGDDVCDGNKDAIKAFGVVNNNISELKCFTSTGFAKIDGDIKLYAEKGEKAILQSEIRTGKEIQAVKDQATAYEMNRLKDREKDANRRYDVEREDNNFNKRCLFPVAGTCSK